MDADRIALVLSIARPIREQRRLTQWEHTVSLFATELGRGGAIDRDQFIRDCFA